MDVVVFLIIIGVVLILAFILLSRAAGDGDYGNKKYVEFVKDVESGLGISMGKKGNNLYEASEGKNKYSIQLQENYLFVQQECHSKIIGSFQVVLKSRYSKMKTFFGKRGVKTGDKEFDDKMLIAAENPSIVKTILHEELREQILSLACGVTSFELKKDSIRIVLEFHEIFDCTVLPEIMRAMSSILMGVNDSIFLKKRLIENFYEEEDWHARLNTVKMLSYHFFRDDDTKLVLNDSLRDEHPEINIEAAKYLKEKGLKFLVSMLESFEDKSDPLIPEIIRILAEKKYKQSIPCLKALFDEPKSDIVQIEILSAFRDFGDEKLNTFLLEKLHIKEYKIFSLVIEALGTCGNLDAVEPLYEMTKYSSDSPVREAAKKAIGLIQSRHGQGDKGWLSMTELSETDGALSISDKAEKGALSVNREKNFYKKQ
ncbi:MAG: HEAT repeat domain-containing protein [bacterium]|nr:HEAT repeat domain-containing protein [bacterium]